MALIWNSAAKLALERELLQTMIRHLQDENKRLTAAILEMKREGFVHQPRPEPEPDRPVVPKEVLAAILEVADPHEALYGEMMSTAQLLIDAGNDPEEVADMIRTGGNASEFM